MPSVIDQIPDAHTIARVLRLLSGSQVNQSLTRLRTFGSLAKTLDLNCRQRSDNATVFRFSAAKA